MLLLLLLLPAALAVDQQTMENAIMSQAQEITQLKAQVTDLQNSCSQSFEYLKENVRKYSNRGYCKRWLSYQVLN